VLSVSPGASSPFRRCPAVCCSGWLVGPPSAVDTHASPPRQAGKADPNASSLAHPLRPDTASARAGRRHQRMRGRRLQPNRRRPATTIEQLDERRASGTRGPDRPGRRVAASAIAAPPRRRGRAGRGPPCAHRPCHDHLPRQRTPRIAPRTQARMAELQLHPTDIQRQRAGRPGRRLPSTTNRPANLPNHRRTLHPILNASPTTRVASAPACLRSPRDVRLLRRQPVAVAARS
jgi:hypothetical protein